MRNDRSRTPPKNRIFLFQMFCFVLILFSNVPRMSLKCQLETTRKARREILERTACTNSIKITLNQIMVYH